MTHLHRLASALGASVEVAPIPCRVAVDGAVVLLATPGDRQALALGLACFALARLSTGHSRGDMLRLARCFENF